MNDFMQLLRSAAARPEPVAPLGSWVMSASPLVAEAMGAAGFAWSVVDMEHSPLDLMGVVHLLQAVAATPMLPVTRVPWNDRVTIKRVLDAGATTLLVPFVQDADGEPDHPRHVDAHLDPDDPSASSVTVRPWLAPSEK